MSCDCFDGLPFQTAAAQCEIEIVQIEKGDRLVVQLGCRHNRVRRHSVAWDSIDFKWVLEWVLNQWVAQQQRRGVERASPRTNAIAA